MPPTIITPSTTAPITRHLRSSVTKSEALSLYRDILRTAKHFHWCDEKGIPWHCKLRAEARKEFEASKEEKDPLIIARMLVTGRECVKEVQRKFNDADRKCWERIQNDVNRGGGAGVGGRQQWWKRGVLRNEWYSMHQFELTICMVDYFLSNLEQRKGSTGGLLLTIPIDDSCGLRPVYVCWYYMDSDHHQSFLMKGRHQQKRGKKNCNSLNS